MRPVFNPGDFLNCSKIAWLEFLNLFTDLTMFFIEKIDISCCPKHRFNKIGVRRYTLAAVLRFIHPPRCSRSNMCFANHCTANKISAGTVSKSRFCSYKQKFQKNTAASNMPGWLLGCSTLLLRAPGCLWLLLHALGCSGLLLGCHWMLLAAAAVCFWLFFLAAVGSCGLGQPRDILHHILIVTGKTRQDSQESILHQIEVTREKKRRPTARDPI